MKDRIRELAEQAELRATLLFNKENLEKFAELIVRECAKVAFDDWCDGTNEGSSQMAILKHFGVE